MLDQYQSPLFRLAAELRDAIYTMALTAGEPIVDPVRNRKTADGTRDPIPPLGAALMRTCKRIYTETNPDVPYRNNTFAFTNPFRGIDFLRHLPVEQRSMIDKVRVDLRCSDPNDLTSCFYTWVKAITCDAPQFYPCKPGHPDCPAEIRALLGWDPKSAASVITFDLIVLQEQYTDRPFHVFTQLQDELFGWHHCENTLNLVGLNSAGDVVKVAGFTKIGNASLGLEECENRDKKIMDERTGRFKVGIGKAV